MASMYLSRFQTLKNSRFHRILSEGRSQAPVSLLTKRSFRWDAKPDNEFGHSFRHGLFEKPPTPILILAGIFGCTLLDWTYLRERFGFKFPDFFSRPEKKPINLIVKDDALPSSLALDIHEKYGDAGLKGLTDGWNQVKDKPLTQDQRAFHAVMMAQAAARYEKEVKEEATKLGLQDDPEIKEQLERMSKVNPSDANQSEASNAGQSQSLLGRFNLKAEEAQQEGGEDQADHKHEKTGFRDRKIIEYENRIRQYSTPDKVFRYFATYRVLDEKGNSEVMMTPQDFLRAITPGEKQPEHQGLDQFIQVSDVRDITTLQTLDKSSVFHQLGSGGLISFSDYIFLLTVLSTSRRHFEIAFKMFDLNGDGTVDADEFEKVTNLLRSNSSTGARHRDHNNTGNTFKGINSGLITFFFGENRKGTLTVDGFLDFQRKLQDEILALEFKKKDRDATGRISERDFASLLIAYAGLSMKERSKMLKRVKRVYEGPTSPGIEVQDYQDFFQVLYCINDIDTALTFHTMAGAPIERSTMQHVARTVARVDLSDHLVDVVFTLFDSNGDGKLSNKEFVSVMKQRALRGLEKPKDMGFSRVFGSLLKCVGDCKPAIVGGQKKIEY